MQNVVSQAEPGQWGPTCMSSLNSAIASSPASKGEMRRGCRKRRKREAVFCRRCSMILGSNLGWPAGGAGGPEGRHPLPPGPSGPLPRPGCHRPPLPILPPGPKRPAAWQACLRHRCWDSNTFCKAQRAEARERIIEVIQQAHAFVQPASRILLRSASGAFTWTICNPAQGLT